MLNVLEEPKPTRNQLSAHPVISYALAANPSPAAYELITYLRHHGGITTSRSTIYLAKATVVAGLFSEDPWTYNSYQAF